MKQIFIALLLIFTTNCFATPLAEPKLNPNIKIEKPIRILVPDTFDESTQALWEQGIAIIRDQQLKEVTLDIRGYGGEMDIVAVAMRTIEEAKANGSIVHGHIVGSAISGHAYFVCALSDFTMEDKTMLYFHNGFIMHSVLFGLIMWKETDADPRMLLSLTYAKEECVKNKILTQSDIKALEDGYEVTIVQTGNLRIKTISSLDTIDAVTGNIFNISVLLLEIGLGLYLVRYLIRSK